MDWTSLDRIPPVKLAMTPFPYALAPDSPLAEAQSMMAEHAIRHLPVRDGAELIGVLNERDVARAHSELQSLKVSDVVERDPFIVDKEAPLDEVLSEMAERHVGAALVVMKTKLVGILTSTDACRLLGDVLRAFYPEDDDRVA